MNLNKYTCDGQLNLFDYLKASEYEGGVKFKITMELPEEWSESKRTAEIGKGIVEGLREALKGAESEEGKK